MQFRLRGADRQSGASAERVIDAVDEQDVRRQASAAGLMIETLDPVGGAAGMSPGYAVRHMSTVIDGSNTDGPALISSRLEKLLNDMERQGWEFVSVETLPALTLAGVGGTRRISGSDVPSNLSVVVFRRIG